MRHTVARGCLLIALVAAPTAASAQIFPTPGLTWNEFTVDFGGVGQLSSIAIDATGRPHIAYFDQIDGDLRYARKNDNNSWSVWWVDASGEAGWGVSLAIDSANNPHIAYYRFPDVSHPGDLKYAKGTCTPSGASALCGWNKVVVDAGVADFFSSGNTSIALDGAGVPHVGYFDNAHDQLKWARKLSTGWDTVNITGSVGGDVSLATDSDNLPHLVYSDTGTGQVKYLHIVCQFILCGWATETIETGLTPTMRRTADGRVHAAYIHDGNVRYALRTCSGSTCTWGLQTVGAAGNGLFPGLAVTGTGAPHICFMRGVFGSADLVYASRSRFGWNLQVADPDVTISGNCSIALDASGNRHISYAGRSDQSLRYTKGVPPPPPVLTQSAAPQSGAVAF